MHSALTTIKTVVNHFATMTDSYMKDEDKLKVIRLNVNFIAQYPEFFGHVMSDRRDVFFGHAVTAKTESLNTVYDLGTIDEDEQKEVREFNPTAAFEELAAHWRLLKAQKKTVIPYIPIESMVAIERDTFSPKLAFRTRYGVIEPKATI